MLFANATFWDWALKFTDKLADPTFLVAIGGFVTLVFKLARDWSIKTDVAAAKTDIAATKIDLKANTEATVAVLPEVSKKMDSATKEVHETAEHLKADTQEVAMQLAIKNEASNAKVADSLKEVKEAIRGDDGTCFTGRLAAHGERIATIEGHLDGLKSNLGIVENRLGNLESGVQTIINMVRDKAAVKV